MRVLVLSSLYGSVAFTGPISDAFEYSKYILRKVCCGDVNKCVKLNFSQCDSLFKQKRMVTFWNRIRKAIYLSMF